MKVLLLAYEFPPIIAAQSLRWFYLSNGLAERGVEVHVVCPEMVAASDFPSAFHPNVIIHRVWPGPFVGFSQSLVKRSMVGGMASATDVNGGNSWKYVAYSLARRVLDRLLYPDVRTEWYPFARTRARHLLADGRFDLIISSHEPGVDLLLGLWAKKRFRLPWVVDLADPLLAPYSPWWRKPLDRLVERNVLRKADAIMVTAASAADLLCERHGTDLRPRLHVIPQGFKQTVQPTRDALLAKPGDTMRMLYTGTFYKGFRSPERLSRALRTMSDSGCKIALTVVGDNMAFEEVFKDVPEVKFVPKTSHFECIAMQRDCDVLLNIGNTQAYQIPGKVYEYLGASRPIFHIRSAEHDLAAELIEQVGAGVVVDNDADQIASALRRVYLRWSNGDLSVPRNEAIIQQHSWDRRADACLEVLRGTLVHSGETEC